MKRTAAALVILALPGLVAAQSMGEAARNARERREKNAKEGVKARSYTQEDVQKAPPLANDPNQAPAVSRLAPTSTGTPNPGSGGTASPGATFGGQSETAWRARIATARERVLSTRKEYEYWTSYTMVPGMILVDEQDRPVITSIAELQAKTEHAKKALDTAEKALVNLEEEARKAAVPPGWLR